MVLSAVFLYSKMKLVFLDNYNTLFELSVLLKGWDLRKFRLNNKTRCRRSKILFHFMNRVDVRSTMNISRFRVKMRISNVFIFYLRIINNTIAMSIHRRTQSMTFLIKYKYKIFEKRKEIVYFMFYS